MIRVLTIVGDLDAGGTQRVAQNCAIGYKKAGLESAVLAMNGGGSREESLSIANVDLFIGGALRKDKDSAFQLAKKWNPTVVHIHRHGRTDLETGLVMREFKERGCPILETNVFARTDYSRDRGLIDVHLHLSRWSLWKWQQWSRIVKPIPIGVVVPNAIDTAAFYPASYEECLQFRKENRIPEEAFVFGRIGQPWLGKWSTVIFDAFQIVANNHQDVYLLLVGLPEELRIKIKLLPVNVRQRVVEIPFIYGDENLRVCYTTMNTFLHASSIGESFGMVLTEAMLCGCPVITLSTPAKDNSQLEVVGHERGGLIVTDKKSMVEAMLCLYSDKPLRERLAKQGAEWVRSKYDISRVMPTLTKIVKIALETRSRNELRDALEKDPDLIMHVDHAEILSLVHNTLGKTSLKNRILMRVVHNPYNYRLYVQWRGMKVMQIFFQLLNAFRGIGGVVPKDACSQKS
jgi:glycosyltransferase involved in cell wall biosynthesis